MPGMTGAALHDELLRRRVRVPVIFITGLLISVKTVEFHRARIMHKLGVRTAAELFRRCLGAS